METQPIIADITNAFNSIIMSVTSKSITLIVKSPLQPYAVNIIINTSDTIRLKVLITSIKGDFLKSVEIKNLRECYGRVVVGIIMACFIENCPDINYFSSEIAFKASTDVAGSSYYLY